MKHETFERLLEDFSTKSVAVVGDFILDEYLMGDTKRVSREAPVIVIDYRESLHHSGGAANAAQNVSSLGASPITCGVIGDDREGSILTDILLGVGASTDLLIREDNVKTAVKTRILAGDLHAQRQQIARIDRSHKLPNGTAALQHLIDNAADIIDRADALIMSDYGLGVIPGELSQKLIGLCAETNTPVVVDSRANLLDFDRATVATPNEVELFDAMKIGKTDGHSLRSLATDVIDRQRLTGLIITRGSRGMHVADSGDRHEQIGIVGSRDVADVTGAGDTVAATVALSLACGGTLFDAAEMATYAAAVVVMKRGTATVDRKELETIRAEYPSPSADGIDAA